MSDDPTSPEAAPEGVSFPPDDDTEGHRHIPNVDGAPSDGRAADGLLARSADRDEDDTEGHRLAAYGMPDAVADGPHDGAEGEGLRSPY